MTIAYPCPPIPANADITVFRAGASLEQVDGKAYREVLSPFALAHERGMDLLGILDEDPGRGEAKLNALQAEVAQAIADADGEGILYRLVGACPDHCTPMQYGGHFLEVDRELLSGATQPVIVFVEGSDIYLDFVADLPCTTMVWDPAQNSISQEDAVALCGDRLTPPGAFRFLNL